MARNSRSLSYAANLRSCLRGDGDEVLPPPRKLLSQNINIAIMDFTKPMTDEEFAKDLDGAERAIREGKVGTGYAAVTTTTSRGDEGKKRQFDKPTRAPVPVETLATSHSPSAGVPAASGAVIAPAPVVTSSRPPVIQSGSSWRCCEDFWLRGTCEKEDFCPMGTHYQLSASVGQSMQLSSAFALGMLPWMACMKYVELFARGTVGKNERWFMAFIARSQGQTMAKEDQLVKSEQGEEEEQWIEMKFEQEAERLLNCKAWFAVWRRRILSANVSELAFAEEREENGFGPSLKHFRLAYSEWQATVGQSICPEIC
ncbi:unnamed protein product [Zymoseptoria tritici ST99CH_1E4]|uniref:Uncharacterized protein n=1 Tax=Zymoseptoria tritici ST99CH_1E4 TaxID=1276532 RepID=A0A2H1H4K3_ZYMTR|nr:unnamed protein product [Zymoseptoria tritici ST99CH_1E4]